MYYLTIKEHFDAAHFLRNYQGKCANMHGHRWVCHVTVKGNEVDECGMVIDFGEIKALVRGIIIPLDHHTLNEIKPFTIVNPTAELIAKYIYNQIKQELITVDSVTVWESPESSCEYREV